MLSVLLRVNLPKLQCLKNSLTSLKFKDARISLKAHHSESMQKILLAGTIAAWSCQVFTFQFFFQVNHFPGTFQIGRKDRLWRNLSRMMVHHGKKVCSSETIYIGYFKSLFYKEAGF